MQEAPRNFVSITGRDNRLFSSPQRPAHALCDLYWRTYLAGKRPNVKLITHFHLVPRLRMSRAIPPLPHASSSRDASGNNFLYLSIYLKQVVQVVTAGP
jgi:hypothetical protein